MGIKGALHPLLIHLTPRASNACKYAYDGSTGDVRILLSIHDMTLELAVEDDGVGWPEGGAVRGTGLGTRLISALARPHHADIRYEKMHPERRVPGTRAVAKLPLARPTSPPFRQCNNGA